MMNGLPGYEEYFINAVGLLLNVKPKTDCGGLTEKETK